MKNCQKKIICILVTIGLLLPVCIPFCAAAEREDAQEPLLLLLGDSIAAGFGVTNPDEACYGRIVADTDHFRYCNLAKPATDSAELLQFMEEGTAPDPISGEDCAVTDLIAQADIICLSVGGNDYFDNPETLQLLLGAGKAEYDEKLDAVADALYLNYCEIIRRIRSVNPDAVIFAQTLYNVWYGMGKKPYHACSDRVNAVIEKYDREHPDTVCVCDISPAMDHKPENLAFDCIHPSASGNVAIAELILQKLHDMGLGTETTPVAGVPGKDWNIYEMMFDNKVSAFLFTALMMLISGNGKNIIRLFRH